jgi:O-antigen ligase
VYVRHLAAPAAACLGLLLLYRPDILWRGPAEALDRAILLVAGAAAFQQIPLPREATRLLSPETETVVEAFSLIPGAGPIAIAIDAAESALALLIFAAAAALFFVARQIFVAGGVRTVARGLAYTGLLLALIAIAQEATAHGLMYWTWRPIDEGPRPFGPFVNRNHFGTWAMLAVPIVLGYLMAHAAAHHGPRPDTPWQQRLLAAMDVRGIVLLAAAVALVFATVLSLSRSGMFGLAITAGCAALLARERLMEETTRHLRPALLVGAAAAISLLIVALRIDPAVISGRFAAAGVGLADRFLIWRDTMAVVRDFWLTGTGVGTYQVSMAVYQQAMPGVIFNQAHNHYLQVVSEGGLLVGIPALLMVVAFVREARARLDADRSGMFWVRAGAASGLCGVAVQSLLETGLTTPANAALAAVAAAIVTHVPPRVAGGRGH